MVIRRESRRNIFRKGFMVAGGLLTAGATKVVSANEQPVAVDPRDYQAKLRELATPYTGEDIILVRATVMTADKANKNGDRFSWEELNTVRSWRPEDALMPAYKTLEGVPIYSDRKNDDVEEAKGKVLLAEWDAVNPKKLVAYYFVDAAQYPHIARGIEMGYMGNVRFGCQVYGGICGRCGNKAQVEVDYCICMKKYKGMPHPEDGKQVVENNFGLNFIELALSNDAHRGEPLPYLRLKG